MRLLARIIAIIMALGFLGSSTLSAMPLVWCIGDDGHRGVENMLHQHSHDGVEVAVQKTAVSVAPAACKDWKLLGTAGASYSKDGKEAPKKVVFATAFPPLKLVIAPAGRPHAVGWATSAPPLPEPSLISLRSVVLLI